MPIRYLLSALLLGGVSIPATAQDAQSLIAKNLEARGGDAALAAIQTIRFDGRAIFPGGMEVAYQETRSKLPSGTAAARVDITLQGLDLVQAYDGKGDAWRINPFQGRKDPVKMSAGEARAMADGAVIEGPLLASRHDGSRVDYLGREDFDGTLAYKLRVTQKDGDEFTYWLDPDTYLEIKTSETRKLRGSEQTNETELGDYEKVAGVYFPMSVESWPQGQDSNRQKTIIATAQANIQAPPDLFAEPGGPVTPAKAAGTPPDASNKTPKKRGSASGPAATKEPTATTPPKGE